MGFYYDSNNVRVGFVVSPAGKFTTFKAPGVDNNSGQGTEVAFFDGLTDAGVIAVNGVDSNDVSHGYLRTRGGEFTEFDPTGSMNTLAFGINRKDTIVGEYFDSSGLHGFVREADGAITRSMSRTPPAPPFTASTRRERPWGHIPTHMAWGMASCYRREATSPSLVSVARAWAFIRLATTRQGRSQGIGSIPAG